MSTAQKLPQSPWTKLHTLAAQLHAKHTPSAAPRSVDPDAVLVTAWRVCVSKPFNHRANGADLLTEVCVHLGIAVVAQNDDRVAQVVETICSSPRYTSGCNPNLTRHVTQ